MHRGDKYEDSAQCNPENPPHSSQVYICMCVDYPVGASTIYDTQVISNLHIKPACQVKRHLLLKLIYLTLL